MLRVYSLHAYTLTRLHAYMRTRLHASVDFLERRRLTGSVNMLVPICRALPLCIFRYLCVLILMQCSVRIILRGDKHPSTSLGGCHVFTRLSKVFFGMWTFFEVTTQVDEPDTENYADKKTQVEWRGLVSCCSFIGGVHVRCAFCFDDYVWFCRLSEGCQRCQ